MRDQTSEGGEVHYLDEKEWYLYQVDQRVDPRGKEQQRNIR